MGVDEGSLQVIDIEVIMENCPIVLLYGTYLPVAPVVFVFHTISYFVTAWVRDRKGIGSGTYKCEMFGEMVGGAGCVGGQEKEWMGCFLDDLKAFGINADQWTTAAQDQGEWRRTAEQGAQHYNGEMDRYRESQGWTTACSGKPERDGKDQGEDSRKQAGSCWFARPC